MLSQANVDLGSVQMRIDFKSQSARWFVAMIIVFGMMAGCVSLLWGNRERHVEILDSLPLGSKVSDLTKLASAHKMAQGNVVAWLPPSDKPPTKSDIENGTAAAIKTKHGTFRREKLNGLEEADMQRFSGTVDFYIGCGFLCEAVLSFVFIDGKLVEKDWGYLPG